MKLLIKLVIGLVLLGVLLVFGAVLFAGKLVKAAIEEGGTYALGVPTTVDDVELGLFSGEFGLSGLAVANPEGFEGESFLTLARADVELGMSTLTSDRIEAPLLSIEGLTLSLERRDRKTNYAVILANLERVQSEPQAPSGKEPAKPGGSADGGPTLLIHEIVLRDITAHVDLVPIAGDALEKTVTLHELRLEQVGDTGESLPQMIARLTTAVLRATVDSLDGQIPPELLAQLRGDFARLDEVKLRLGEDTRAKLDEAAQELEAKVRDGVNDAVEKGLNGLFKKKQD